MTTPSASKRARVILREIATQLSRMADQLQEVETALLAEPIGEKHRKAELLGLIQIFRRERIRSLGRLLRRASRLAAGKRPYG